MITRLDCLIVEDDPTVRLCLEVIVRTAGHHVSLAVDGASAQAKILQRHYDIVVSDVRLPEVDGLSLARLLQTTSPLTKTILISAYATPPEAVLAMKLGVYEYLVKPIEEAELVKHLTKLLEDFRAAAEVVAPSLAQASDSVEKECIIAALEALGGQRKKTADALGISRRTLWLKLRKYGLSNWGR